MSQQLDTVARRQALLEALRRWGQVHARPNQTKPLPPRAAENMHRVMSGLFAQQRQVVVDPSKRIALFCTRRAGKTSALAPWAVQANFDCRDNEGTTLVIGPTLEHAKALMWRPLENLSRTYDLGLDLRNDPARCHFPNGTIIYFRGAKDREQLGVLRGFKLINVFCDEVQEIRDDLLRETITATGAGLRDLGGRFIASGTPGRVPVGEWFEITTGLKPHWSVHSWSLFDNPFLPDDAKDVELILREEGLTLEDPRFKREYMGLWVEDTDELVYAFDIERNGLTADTVVLDPQHTWHYVMGLDFGYNDDSAAVVGAFSFESDIYYEVAESGGKDLTLSDFMTGHVLPLIRKYDPMRIVGDPQAKQLIAEINQRWELNILKADKPGKLAYIELMNSDFRLRRIKTPIHFRLVEERQKLVWDPAAKPRLEEHPRRPNHYCDAGLYCYREAKHWIGKKIKAQMTFASDADREAYYWKQYIRRQAERGQHSVLADWSNDDDFY